MSIGSPAAFMTSQNKCTYLLLLIIRIVIIINFQTTIKPEYSIIINKHFIKVQQDGKLLEPLKEHNHHSISNNFFTFNWLCIIQSFLFFQNC